MKKKAPKPAAKKAQKAPAKKGKAAPAKVVFSASQLAQIRKKLVEMREDLVSTVRKQAVTEIEETGDAADQASQSLEREILFNLSDNERAVLDQVEAALRKIEKGSYGVCESCRKGISKARLDALPFARYCIGCQSTSERPLETVEPPEFKVVEE
ncbi:MAG: TraR/DksA family transcriptional regulator [Elusimicrobia bacterium]|nr:TraR/DksA family transcriptional regulator [Elusimicrobiota bacterium]